MQENVWSASSGLYKDIPLSRHNYFMQLALQESTKCPSTVYYSVGAVLADMKSARIITGYTGEMLYQDTAYHAEEVVLEKLKSEDFDLSNAVLYSTMEPCSERKSGHTSCTELIINAGIKNVVFGCLEPYDPKLDIYCHGVMQLRAARVNVMQLKKFEERCKKSVVAPVVTRNDTTMY